MNRFGSLLLLAGLNILIIKLYINNELILYIHPRYLIFTLAMNILSISVIAIALGMSFVKSRNIGLKSIKKPKVLALLTAAVVVAGLYLPPAALSSSSVSQRADSSQIEPTQCMDIDDNDTEKTFQEWHTHIITCDEPDLYRDKPVKLEGFVYREVQPSNPEDEEVFMIARFRVSCCAVDAFPLLIPVLESDISKDLSSDQWIKLEGKLRPKRFMDGVRIVVVPESIDRISQPDNPYEFITY